MGRFAGLALLVICLAGCSGGAETTPADDTSNRTAATTPNAPPDRMQGTKPVAKHVLLGPGASQADSHVGAGLKK